jgi:hypothetical protein
MILARIEYFYSGLPGYLLEIRYYDRGLGVISTFDIS